MGEPKLSTYSIPGELIAKNSRGDLILEGEAQAIQDAFESLTNGMITILDSLQSISIPSLQPWKQLITALDALYGGNFKEAESLMTIIDDVSAPGLLKPAVLALCGNEAARLQRKEFRGKEKHLYNKIAEDRNFVKSVVIQLIETLEAGEEYFHEFALMSLREIKEIDHELSLRLALWILNEFYDQDFDYTAFLEDMKQIYPPWQVMRLSALVLTPEDWEEGVKCWLLSLLFRSRDGSLTREEAAEYLWVVNRLLEISLNEENELEQLMVMVGRELEQLFSLTLSPVDQGKSLANTTAVWATFLAPMTKPEFQNQTASEEEETSPRGQRAPKKDAPPLQLELFGCPDELEEEEPPQQQPGLDFTQEVTRSKLFSPCPLNHPNELRELVRTRPRYVGPELWLDVIKQKRKGILRKRQALSSSRRWGNLKRDPFLESSMTPPSWPTKASTMNHPSRDLS